MRRHVLVVLDRTLGDGDGPRNVGELGGAFGNRGPGGPPAFFWRADDDTWAWEDGTPPVKCGEYYEP